MSMYTKEIEAVFKSIKSPYPGFIVDVVERPGQYLELRVYKDNIEDYSDAQKVQLAGYLFQLRDAIREIQPHCHIQGVTHAPPNKTR